MISTKIYALANAITGEIRYIGLTTTTLQKRLNSHMQNARSDRKSTHRSNWINSLKSKPQIILIDEIFDQNIQWWLEEYWIEQFKNWGFKLVNSTNGGAVPITKPGLDNPNFGNKYRLDLKTTKGSIVQLDLDGNHVRTLKCAAEAEVYGLHKPTISRCLNGKRNQHNGFQFIRLEDYDPSLDYKHQPVNTQKRKIAQLDPLTETIIKLYDSASSIPNINKSKVYSVCRGDRKTHMGFKWAYVN